MVQESAYALLYKVVEAKRLCIKDGNHRPKTEDIAARVGMTVEKLESFLSSVRKPVSIDQPVWTDQSTTYQVSFCATLICSWYNCNQILRYFRFADRKNDKLRQENKKIEPKEWVWRYFLSSFVSYQRLHSFSICRQSCVCLANSSQLRTIGNSI